MELADELRACEIAPFPHSLSEYYVVLVDESLRDRILAALTERKAPVEVEGLVERIARAICLEDGRAGDTEAVEQQRVDRDWRDYEPSARAVGSLVATELATLKQQLEMAVEHIEELTDLYKQEVGLEDQPQPEIREAMAFLAQKDRV